MVGDYPSWANAALTSDTLYYNCTASSDYITYGTVTYSPPAPAIEAEPKEESVEEWLDRRVEEMRVKL